MDPALFELMDAGRQDEEVSVILRLEEGATPPETVRVVSRFGQVVTARLRRGDIPATWNHDAVASLKAARPVHDQLPIETADEAAAASAEMERFMESAEEGGAQEAAAGAAAARPVPEDGTGVVIGVCDWGIDFTHPNFRNPDGTTRLEAIWDQRGPASPLSPAPFDRGRLLTAEMINAALASPDPFGALRYHPWVSDPTQSGTHGTHVVDIAAGNRREPGSQVGLASGATLVFVHLAPQHLDDLENLGDSVGLLEGLDFVRRQANGRPCVLHLSAGKTGGSKLGLSLLERAVDTMLLETPDLVLVQSVGNYGDAAMHTHARVGPDQHHVLHWLIPHGDRTPNELEVWYSGQDVFELTLVAPDGRSFVVPLGRRLALRDDGGEHWGNLYHREHEPNTGMNHIDIVLYTAAPTGEWQVRLHGRDVVDGRLHAWIERDAGPRNQSRFPRSQATARYTTNTICNCFRAIAVGAYDATRPNRPPAHFTSRGPTADGRQKPEVAAPGSGIRAARSTPRGGWHGEPRLCVKSGTSMAAPWVSGTVALMFQAAGRPLTIHEVRRILIGTAFPVPGPRGRSSTQLGYGYLNIVGAVEEARRWRGATAAAGPAPDAGAVPATATAFGWPRPDSPLAGSSSPAPSFAFGAGGMVGAAGASVANMAGDRASGLGDLGGNNGGDGALDLPFLPSLVEGGDGEDAEAFLSLDRWFEDDHLVPPDQLGADSPPTDLLIQR